MGSRSSSSLLASARAAVKRAAVDTPLEPHVRKAAQLVEPRATRRDRRDNEAMTLLIAATLGPEDCGIDVGANEGRVLTDIVRCAPAGKHIAYEPIPAFHERLSAQFPTVDVRRAALANEAGETEFTFVKSHPGYSGIRERSYPGREELEKISVAMERLDDTLPEGCEPAFLKIDVEGAEVGVLQGAVETLSRHRPTVAFEHGKGAAPAYGVGPRDVYDLLVEQAGLRIYDMDGVGPFSVDQLEEAFELGTRWNFFARA